MWTNKIGKVKKISDLATTFVLLPHPAPILVYIVHLVQPYPLVNIVNHLHLLKQVLTAPDFIYQLCCAFSRYPARRFSYWVQLERCCHLIPVSVIEDVLISEWLQLLLPVGDTYGKVICLHELQVTISHSLSEFHLGIVCETFSQLTARLHYCHSEFLVGKDLVLHLLELWNLLEQIFIQLYPFDCSLCVGCSLEIAHCFWYLHQST